MAALAPLPQIIAKLLPRLGSPHDGEIVATVRAIERTLHSASLDWHDLTGALTNPTGPAAAKVHYHPSSAKFRTWEDAATWCRDNARGRLDAREFEFVSDLADRLMFDDVPTPKQAAWLKSIHAKLRRQAA